MYPLFLQKMQTTKIAARYLQTLILQTAKFAKTITATRCNTQIARTTLQEISLCFLPKQLVC